MRYHPMSFDHGLPELTSLNLSESNIYDHLHLPRQCVESAPLGGHCPRWRVAQEVFGVVRSGGKEGSHGKRTIVRPSTSRIRLISLVL